IPLTLQPLIEKFVIFLAVFHLAGGVYFNALQTVDANLRHGLAYFELAPDEDGNAVARLVELDRGTDDLFLFPFGEDDAARRGAGFIENGLQGAGGRIATGAQLVPVRLFIDDRPARNA